MTIILFLVDTSSSMNQRTYLGTSLIDIAKASVETFMKVTGVSKWSIIFCYFYYFNFSVTYSILFCPSDQISRLEQQMGSVHAPHIRRPACKYQGKPILDV